MSAPVDLKYRAFLSYAHGDASWGTWLHRALEGFRIDKDLFGRVTPLGPVPKTLRPIFRDRDDFSGGHTLTNATIAALDQSAALIVLCSIVSATRPAVNEEVRLFKSRHPNRPVIPVIIEGHPPDNFPPALRFAVAADGTVMDQPVTILAPDLRESGDGRELGLAKVIGGLTGLAPDDIYRRAERTRRRSANIRNAVIAVLAVFVVAAAGSAVYAWQQLKTNEAFLEATLRSATEIVNEAVAQAEKYSVPRTATLALLTRAESLFENMARYGRPTPSFQRQKAWMLIQFARNYAIVGDTTKRQARADEASRIMAALVSVGGADWESERTLAATGMERGDLLRTQGKLPDALTSYIASRKIVEKLVHADPGNAELQRDLGFTQAKIGEVLKLQGNLVMAKAAFNASFDLYDHLAKADPGNAGWQRDLSGLHERIGEVLFDQGNLPAALVAYNASLSIRDGLLKADPGHADWQHGLAAVYQKKGDVFRAQGNLVEALTSYVASRDISDGLAKTDPGNTVWQRDLGSIQQRIGVVFLDQGKLAEASTAHEATLGILVRLVKTDPRNADWQRDLSVAYGSVGDVLRLQGDLAGSLTAYKASFEIVQLLANADPRNADWQRNLSVSHGKIGDVFRAQGNHPAALDALKASLAISERLARADPGNASWQADLAANHGKLGQLYQAMGRRKEALDTFRTGRSIAAPLAERSGQQLWENYVKSFDADIAVTMGSGPAEHDQ